MFPVKRKGDVALAIYLVFESVDGGGVPGDRNVSFIVAAKEVTESNTPVGVPARGISHDYFLGGVLARD